MSQISPLQFYKCLADEIRLKSLLLIHQEQELCVCELMEALDESQPKISRHLAQLRTHGLLLDRRQGQWVYYRLHPDLDDWAKQVIEATYTENEGYLSDNILKLKQMQSRPNRASACC